MCFEEFVGRLQLENFEPHELLEHTDRPPNAKPEPDLWDNIVPTILIVQELRSHFNVPIYLSSTYRNEAYNRLPRINGAPYSLHQAYAALDIRIDSSYKGELTNRDLYDQLLLWRNEERWFRSPVCICTHPVTLSNEEQTPHQDLEVRQVGREYEFRFRGGLNYYERKNYIHIDTRGVNEDF